MSRTIRIGTIALLVILMITLTAACTKKIDTSDFISILAKRQISAQVVQNPNSENGNVEIVSGVKKVSGTKNQGIRVFLYTSGDVAAAKDYYTKQQQLFDSIASSEGVTGSCDKTESKDVQKTIAKLSFLNDDGSAGGTYSVLIQTGRSVITIVADGADDIVVAEVDQIVNDLGFGE